MIIPVSNNLLWLRLGVFNRNLVLHNAPRDDFDSQYYPRLLWSLRPLYLHAAVGATAGWGELANRASWIQKENKAALALGPYAASPDWQVSRPLACLTFQEYFSATSKKVYFSSC